MTDATVSVDSVVDAAAVALTGTPKVRKPSVSAAEFVAAMAEATKREKRPTAAELADELGMNKGSFDQRLNSLRNDWKDMVKAKEDGTHDAEGKAKPFPFVLADGRSSGGEGNGRTSKNAIMAALMAAD